MKLPTPFARLPLQFDAPALASEIGQFDESEWHPHVHTGAGDAALPLVAVGGDPGNDDVRGAMGPTPNLQRCPYLQQVIGSLGAVVGRASLVRVSGADLPAQVDTSYYGWQRVRVHVPIITQPGARFVCGDAEVHMAAGECWVLDTWRTHRLIGAAQGSCMHLVVDTVGGEGFSSLVSRGWPYNAPLRDWSPASVPPRPNEKTSLKYESQNVPTVMTPWELREYLYFVFNEVAPHPRLTALRSAGNRLEHAWQALWACHGEDRRGWPEYRITLNRFIEQMREVGADVKMRNATPLAVAVTALADAVLADGDAVGDEPRPARASVPATVAHAQPETRFDRPVFIVSSPRSGSTLLYETLAKVPRLYTIGGESHALIEGIPALHPGAREFSSNRLTADDASAAVAAELRAGMDQELRDRDGAAPPGGRIRVLEKTPKNALRIPFLARVFPEARFVYLHRDVRETLASMIEAWQSGRFRTYPMLPGWNGLPWSLLLVPGWPELIDKPLEQVVAKQWETTTRVLLDDLEALPPDRWISVGYAEFVADPQAQISRLCRFLDLDWDQALGSVLPPSRYTLTAPAVDKWRRHEREIGTVLPRLAGTIERAERFLRNAGQSPNA